MVKLSQYEEANEATILRRRWVCSKIMKVFIFDIHAHIYTTPMNVIFDIHEHTTPPQHTEK